jgi:hypothetical protein
MYKTRTKEDEEETTEKDRKQENGLYFKDTFKRKITEKER